MKNLRKILLVTVLLNTFATPLAAQSVSDVDSKLSDAQSQYDSTDKELAQTQEEYETLVEESKVINDQIKATNDEIASKQANIDKIKAQIPVVEQQASATLGVMQKNIHVNYIIDSMASGDEGGMLEQLRIASAANRLTETSMDKVDELIAMEEEINADMEALTELSASLEEQKAEADSKSKELSTLINDQQQELLDQESELESQEAQKKFLEDAGCTGDDVYGVDCGVEIPEVSTTSTSSANTSSTSAKTSKASTATGSAKATSSGFSRPLATGVVTNEFGGYDGYGTGHRGIDVANSYGTPVYSVADGVVIDAGTDVNRGNYVTIVHNVNGQNTTSSYWHMSSINVSVGQSVTANTQVGAIGASGIATGPHLHFAMNANSTTFSNERGVNPRQFVSFPSLGTWFYSR